ncbi:transporter [Cognatishimia sp. MH4019]|uniref:transporter n=1 Tax=Cognatishimia sp. MH4019 TaxID=2854030 RepID=UPI001CD5B218|nr:transporter [Cognatishimia sp. MH4019]
MSDVSLTENTAQGREGRGLIVLFTLTIFLSASLLFFVQPLFAKLVLPVIGGAPAVWTTAMLFFQTVLIAGYLYAHILVRYVPIRAQLGVHLGFWALGLWFLPLAIPESWSFDPNGPITLQTLGLFALGVGVPFAVLSANAPLIQAWYRASGAPSGDDPYFLYGASNLGSMVALLAFPLVAEPILGATAIGQGWAAGFIAFGMCLMAIAWTVFSKPAKTDDATVSEAPKTRIDADRIAIWLLLAFVPSSLMLAVTSKISTDMGTIPMVWVLPLALFLATFVLTFRSKAVLPDEWLKALSGIGVVFLIYTFTTSALSHGQLLMVAGLIASFFGVSLYAHRQLYLARPDAGSLTTFYLVMSVGGALGGLFNSIIAPVVFDSLREGSATVVMAAIIPLFLNRPKLSAGKARIAAWSLGGLALLSVVMAGLLSNTGFLIGAAGAALVLSLLFTRPLVTFGVAISAATLSGTFIQYSDAHFVDRSFFGAHLVRDDVERDLRAYMNGTTVHGKQRLSDLGAEHPVPLSYYHPELPMAQVLQSDLARGASDIGIIGLGIGSLACYRQPGQTYHYYEVDSMVDQVARDPNLFTYMSACAGDQPTYLGDARVVLEQQHDLKMSVVVIDAYSSDAVPVHLTTTEAMQLYLDRTTEDGVVLYHVSNRFYDIDVPLARSAAALGLNIWLHEEPLTEAQYHAGASASSVVMIARQGAKVEGLLEAGAWRALRSDGGRLWTDDYANPLSILSALR